MIAAAEQLVAERGLGAVSMRMVGEAAGQRNHSAVQFHFGTWEGLLQSIAANRMGPINQERLAMLEQLDLEGRPADVRGLIEALIVPLSKWTIRRSGSFYARFLAVVMPTRSGPRRYSERRRVRRSNAGAISSNVRCPSCPSLCGGFVLITQCPW